MINPKILVTGATGRTGRVVVTQLLAKGWPVRAAVRVRDARSDLLQCRGAEVVVADVFDPGQLITRCAVCSQPTTARLIIASRSRVWRHLQPLRGKLFAEGGHSENLSL
ncbi:MAG TPA: NAD(P)H-binding protein [Chthoniobacterales bacterium]|nr:NAD(P)H-binding protein [Chthoniobacterales bacterium]